MKLLQFSMHGTWWLVKSSQVGSISINKEVVLPNRSRSNSDSDSDSNSNSLLNSNSNSTDSNTADSKKQEWQV